MTSFESSICSVTADSSIISEYLSQPENLIDILPSDRIEDWKCTGETCSFRIKGLATIKLKLTSASSERVVYDSEDGPFDFQLIVRIEHSDAGSAVTAYFDADVSSMMAVMLKSPLTNFLNSLGEALEAKFSAG